MSDRDPKKPSKPDGAKAREERLAQALRDNLKRRKAQGRARKSGDNVKDETR